MKNSRKKNIFFSSTTTEAFLYLISCLCYIFSMVVASVPSKLLIKYKKKLTILVYFYIIPILGWFIIYFNRFMEATKDKIGYIKSFLYAVRKEEVGFLLTINIVVSFLTMHLIEMKRSSKRVEKTIRFCIFLFSVCGLLSNMLLFLLLLSGEM